MNVDGAIIRGNRGGAVAAICRNSEGTYLGSSAVVYRGITDPLILETYACREALLLAEDLAIQSFTVASDCQGAITDINMGTRGPHAAIVHEIMARRSSFTLCTFVFESRSSNVEAHRLARFALNLAQGRHVWFDQPHDPVCIPPSVEFDQ